MLSNAVTVGTPTSTGGKVLTGSAGVKINNRDVCVLGDQATCCCGAKNCRGIGLIVQGSLRNIKVGNKLIAMKDDPVDTGCGNCFVLSSHDAVSLGEEVSGLVSMGVGVNFGQGVNINIGSNVSGITRVSRQYVSPIGGERVSTTLSKEKTSHLIDSDKLIINDLKGRKESILNNTPAIFEIVDNPKADSSKPLAEVSAFNPIDNGSIYNEIGAKYGLNPDWLKAIAYMENTHGWYDGFPLAHEIKTLATGSPPSYRPMNIQYETWKPLAEKLGYSEWQVQYRVYCNVELAALLLKRITVRVQQPTLAKVSSIYNYLGRENVSDYGARVQEIYNKKLWEK